MNQAYLKNGTSKQSVRHLEWKMALNRLEADEHLAKTQMTGVKQQPSSQIAKLLSQKTKTSNTVPNDTLQTNQFRYCRTKATYPKSI